MKFHVVKSSREYNGAGYSGPSLNRIQCDGLTRAEFESKDDAIKCAQQLSEINPVGFDVYDSETQQKIYPTNESDVEAKK